MSSSIYCKLPRKRTTCIIFAYDTYFQTFKDFKTYLVETQNFTDTVAEKVIEQSLTEVTVDLMTSLLKANGYSDGVVDKLVNGKR